MQLLDQTPGLPLLDDKTEIQIAGRLADQMNPVLGKDTERGTDLMQDRPDFLPDEADDLRIVDNLDPAQAFERLAQPGQRSGI